MILDEQGWPVDATPAPVARHPPIVPALAALAVIGIAAAIWYTYGVAGLVLVVALFIATLA